MARQELANDLRPSRNRRLARRYSLALSLTAKVAGANRTLVLRDLSRTGFLAEALPRLELGETVEIDLPDRGPQRSLVVWTGDTLAGCTFATPISQAALSSALLRGEPRTPVDTIPGLQAFAASLSDRDLDTLPVEKLPGFARLTIIGGAAFACWLPILAIAYLALG